LIYRALVGCAVAASTVAALTAAPALAQSRSLDDGTGDVWSAGVASGPRQTQVVERVAAAARGVTQAQPGERVNGDLVSTKVNHTVKAVRATATYDRLVRNTDSFQYVMALKRQDGKEFWVYAGATPDDRNGSITLSKANGDKVKCGGKEHEVSYAKDQITFSIPRSCLGKPRWVKYESAAIVYDAANNYFIDDAASDQSTPSEWSARLHKG
jgi:hypothetical protein